MQSLYRPIGPYMCASVIIVVNIGVGSSIIQILFVKRMLYNISFGGCQPNYHSSYM